MLALLRDASMAPSHTTQEQTHDDNKRQATQTPPQKYLFFAFGFLALPFGLLPVNFFWHDRRTAVGALTLRLRNTHSEFELRPATGATVLVSRHNLSLRGRTSMESQLAD